MIAGCNSRRQLGVVSVTPRTPKWLVQAKGIRLSTTTRVKLRPPRGRQLEEALEPVPLPSCPRGVPPRRVVHGPWGAVQLAVKGVAKRQDQKEAKVEKVGAE